MYPIYRNLNKFIDIFIGKFQIFIGTGNIFYIDIARNYLDFGTVFVFIRTFQFFMSQTNMPGIPTSLEIFQFLYNTICVPVFSTIVSKQLQHSSYSIIIDNLYYVIITRVLSVLFIFLSRH